MGISTGKYGLPHKLHRGCGKTGYGEISKSPGKYWGKVIGKVVFPHDFSHIFFEKNTDSGNFLDLYAI